MVVRPFVKEPIPPIPETVRDVADTLESFLSYFPTFELLTSDEEVWLAREIQKGKRSRYPFAKDRMVVHNLRLVVSEALRYARQRRVSDPSYVVAIITEGILGLMTTCDRFDWRQGFRFSTYATHWIKRFIHRGSNELRFIRLPHYIHGILAKTPSTLERLRSKKKGRGEPNTEEIATAMNERVGSYELAVEAGRATNIIKPGLIDDGEHCDQPLEFVGKTDADEDPLFITLARESTDLLWRALGALTTREATIVMMRHGIECEAMTLAEIGERYCLSRERIRQVERAALDRMKRYLEKIHESEGPYRNLKW